MNPIIQRALASVALLVLSPVIAAVAVAVLVFSGRPIIYSAERIGKDCQTFTQLKFRTMIQGADKQLDSALGAPTGSRVTRVGAILRKSSLDELPQLVNVARGDMALVGPRPLLPAMADKIPADHDRYKVLPGITGLAQISGRNLLVWSKRLERDAEYVATRSLRVDVQILCQTLAKVVSGSDIAPDRNTSEVMDL